MNMINREERLLEERSKLATRIKELRKVEGWSQEDLEDETELSRRTIGHVENARFDLKFSTICKIARALHVSVSYLLDFEEDLERKEYDWE